MGFAQVLPLPKPQSGTGRGGKSKTWLQGEQANSKARRTWGRKGRQREAGLSLPECSPTPLQWQGTCGTSAKPWHPWHLSNVGVPTASLQCWGAHLSSGAIPGCPHPSPILGGLQPVKVPLPFLQVPRAASAAPSITAPSGGLLGTGGRQGGVSRSPQGLGFSPEGWWRSVARRRGQVGRQNLRVQLLLQDRNCARHACWL